MIERKNFPTMHQKIKHRLYEDMVGSSDWSSTVRVLTAVGVGTLIFALETSINSPTNGYVGISLMSVEGVRNLTVDFMRLSNKA